MDLLAFLIDFVLHVDKHLAEFVALYGAWVYALLFAVIFVETGLVVMPFLPGDSLIFAAGAFAARGALNVWALFIVLSLAAILGDTVNYWIGHRVGSKAYSGEVKWVKKEHMERTHAFFDKYAKIFSSSTAIATFRMPVFSPRFIARMRCGTAVATPWEKS